MPNLIGIGGVNGAPTGTVAPYSGATAPVGFLLCNGAAVSRTTYSALFAIVGTTYGAGDGSTTFNLPNTQGIFVRGAGNQTIGGVGYSGTRGTLQNDNVQDHSHSYSDPGHRHGIVPENIANNDRGGSPGNFSIDTDGLTQFSATGITINGMNSGRSGAETRPANLALNYIIKY